MRAWADEVLEHDTRLCRRKAWVLPRQAVQALRLTRDSQANNARSRNSMYRAISNDISENVCAMNKNHSQRQPLGRSRSRSADITPYDEHDRSRSPKAIGDFDEHGGKYRQGYLRAWEDEDVPPLVKQPTMIITCEHIHGSVKCTNLGGNVVGDFIVPGKEDPYGAWLGMAVCKAHRADVGELCLVKRDGKIFWRKAIDQKTNSMSKHQYANSNGHSFTGRERFKEGHDDRDGGCFAEYYTPRRRPYTHRDRWIEGHDDRDGKTYADHASSVRPFSDPQRFARQ